MLRSKICDLDLDSNLITIRERKKSHDRRTTRRVQMSVPSRDVLQSWLDTHPGGEYTFCHGRHVPHSRANRPQISPLTVHEAHDHFKRTLNGTKWDKLRGWHVFRHSFCCNRAAEGDRPTNHRCLGWTFESGNGVAVIAISCPISSRLPSTRYSVQESSSPQRWLSLESRGSSFKLSCPNFDYRRLLTVSPLRVAPHLGQNSAPLQVRKKQSLAKCLK